MELIIKDVPDVESVKNEILENAINTISNYLKSQVPKSQELIQAEVEIATIRGKNIVEKIIEEVKAVEDGKDGLAEA